MKEILITSSVLILALLALRRIFRNTVSRQVQYALWGLVLLRLLLPFNLPPLEHNVLTAMEPVEAAVSRRLDSPLLYIAPIGTAPASGYPGADTALPGEVVPSVQSFGYPVLSRDGTMVTTYASRLERPFVPAEALAAVWYTGMAAMACWFLLSNLRFWRMLRKTRTPFPAESCDYPVYLVERGLTSPCLFGLFRPAVYLTPAAASPQSLRHVLAHETAHARHLDPLWSLLRAVCLTVYWFNPLVWIAAAASRTDCELACDEGALRVLGESERIAYGKTLLALIPVSRRPANPLLSATTMAAGKRQLRDRITRIAENRRTAGAALFIAAAAAALVCAATFTGAAPENSAPSGTSGRPLTGEELQFFNGLFLDSEGYPSRLNQFLTSLYDAPENIDLYELLYNGTGEPLADGEREAVAAAFFGGEDPGVDLSKASSSAIDELLTEYTGLTLGQTNQINLDAFQYLESYDAYYLFHGDTNLSEGVCFTSGSREDGLIRLYYDAAGRYLNGEFAESWACLTLRETRNGRYLIVSHLLQDAPAVPTAYPAGEPWMTVPLDGLEPSPALPLPVERHTDDCAERLGSVALANGNVIRLYRSTDGNAYAAVVRDAPLTALTAGTPSVWESDCFFTLPESFAEHLHASQSFGVFSGLLGRDGICFRYPGQLENGRSVIFNDYCAVGADGTPSLLLRACGDVDYIDLDGNGSLELAASRGDGAQIFFPRDGGVCCADIGALLPERWAEAEHLSFGSWDAFGRKLPLSGEVSLPGGARVTAGRDLYFDGENLLIYRDGRSTEDHLAEGIDAPEDVLEAAGSYVQAQYAGFQTGGLPNLHDGAGEWSPLEVPAAYDDWRVERLSGPFFESLDGLRFEIWQMNYELHTTTPERVVLAGGAYLTEEGWHCPTYPNCTYLCFRLAENGARTYLYAGMENDCAPGSETFVSDMAAALAEMGLLPSAELDGGESLAQFTANPSAFLRSAAALPEAERQAVLQGLAQYYGGGTSAQRARFRDAMASLTQEALDADATEAFELLRACCVLPGPANRTAGDESAILAAVQAHLDSRRQSPDCLYLASLAAEIDEEETALAVRRYTASLLANSRGWTDEYASRMVAVRAVYDAYYDFFKTAASPEERRSGVNARCFYLLPNPENGAWEIWDFAECAVPREYQNASLDEAVHRAVLENTPTTAGPPLFKTEAHDLIAVEQGENSLIVYTYFSLGEYGWGEAGPEIHHGGRDLAGIIFSTAGGSFQTSDFWSPIAAEDAETALAPFSGMEEDQDARMEESVIAWHKGL